MKLLYNSCAHDPFLILCFQKHWEKKIVFLHLSQRLTVPFSFLLNGLILPVRHSLIQLTGIEGALCARHRVEGWAHKSVPLTLSLQWRAGRKHQDPQGGPDHQLEHAGGPQHLLDWLTFYDEVLK